MVGGVKGRSSNLQKNYIGFRCFLTYVKKELMSKLGI